MTRILFDPRTDTAAGTRPLGATVTARATQVREDHAVVTYPSTIGWRFTATERPEMLLPAPAAGWAWILEVVPDEGRSETRVVRFIEGPPVAYADLTDVDPATLVPGERPAEPAWNAVLDELRTRITPTVAISQAGYAALNPPDPSTLYLITS